MSFARRMQPPENEIPAAVAISTLLARTDEVAIGLIGAHAYTHGLRFNLAVRFRREPRGTMAQKSNALLNGYPGEDSAEPLLLGMEYADGRTVTNFQNPGFRGMPAAGDPAELSLSPTGGGGGGRSFDQSLWLTPLPPDGPLLVVCAWSAVGIAECRTILDGTAIAEAGSRAVTLWAPLPPEADEPFEPPVPRVPEGGWFAAVIGTGARQRRITGLNRISPDSYPDDHHRVMKVVRPTRLH